MNFSMSPPPPASVSQRRGDGTPSKSANKKPTEVIDLCSSSGSSIGSENEEGDSPMRMRFSISQSQAVNVCAALEFGTPFKDEGMAQGLNEMTFKIRESIQSSSSASSPSSESEAEFDERDDRFKFIAEEKEDDVSFIVDSDDLYEIETTSGSGSDLDESDDSWNEGEEDEDEDEEDDESTKEMAIDNNSKSVQGISYGRNEENCFDFSDLTEVIMEYEPVKPIKAATSSPLDKSPARQPLKEIESTPKNSKSMVSVLKRAETREGRKFTKKERDTATLEAFVDFNHRCFDDILPADLSISWNKRLRTTAGVTKMKTKRYSTGKESVRIAAIELSEKVVDDLQRLKTTLLHEMCHAAAWLVDGQKKPPHGPAFWKWASIAGARSGGYLVTTCHNYDIHRPFKWQCTNKQCGLEYTRHSKKGIDPLRHRCGKCRGRIEFVGAFNADMTPRKTRAATGFSLFVQEHFANVKNSLKKKGKKNAHQSVMQELSRLYASSKQAREVGGGSASKAFSE